MTTPGRPFAGLLPGPRGETEKWEMYKGSKSYRIGPGSVKDGVSLGGLSIRKNPVRAGGACPAGGGSLQ